MIIHPPVEATFDDGTAPRKSWVDWCVSVFRNSKFKGSGTTADRPVNGLNIGDWFFDTTLNRPVFAKTISPVAWVDIASGTVLQSAYASKTDTFSMGSTTFADVTGLSVTITPNSTTNKVLIWAMLSCGNPVSDQGYVRIVRDSTNVLIGDAASNRIRVTTAWYQSDVNSTENVFVMAQDTPGTISAVTYKIQIASSSGGTIYINRSNNDTDDAAHSRGVSTLLVQEIQQ